MQSKQMSCIAWLTLVFERKSKTDKDNYVLYAILWSVFPRTSSFAPGNFCWKLTTQKMQMPCTLSIFLEKSLYSDSLQKGLSAIFLKQQGKLTHTWLPVLKSLDIWNFIVRIRFYVPNLKLRRKLQFGRGAIILWGKFCKDKSKSKTFRKFKENW